MNGTGLVLTRAGHLTALAGSLDAWLRALEADPFEAPLVFTPGAGVQRWLSQYLANASPDGQGICAGVRFEPLSRLEPLLSGRDPADDPWGPQRVVWRILELVDAGTPGLDMLAHHLAASEQRYANAARVATLLHRYARLRPALLRAWSLASSSEDLGLGVHTWQPVLWRALHDLIDVPDPVQRHDTLLDDLASGHVGPDAPAIGVFAPRQLTAVDADLLQALAASRRVDVWLRSTCLGDRKPPLVTRLGSRADETAGLLSGRAASVIDLPQPPAQPRTLLGHLQAEAAGLAGSPFTVEAGDRSIDVHACHGLDRQAEVLREVLTNAFAEDSTLEPRDVVIACPEPAALAPHLSAVFTPDDSRAAHPGRSLRVQIAERGAIDANALYSLIRSVAELSSSRARASQLLALATHPFVARRFGLGDDDTERLGELVEQAAVRWGISDAHRRAYGLTNVRQGTWQVGVQRLLLGEALSDDELPSAGIIAPVDDVESSDIEAVGALAELVSRVSRLAARPDLAPASAWVQHYRSIVDELADVPFDQSWQLAQVWGVLSLLERRAGDSSAELSAADALALLDAEFAQRSARPAYGDGSLVVCGLADLAGVPHRVVCLVGLDESTFPRRGLPDGDDLVAAKPGAGDPDPGRDDRQTILDAFTAATERLVVLYQGWSSHTREQRPVPAGVLELLEAAAGATGLQASDLVVDEPLQPFSPTLFGSTPRSFDEASLRAARVLVSPVRRPEPNRYEVGYLPLIEPVETLELTQVRSFLTHPAKYFLKERAGLTLTEDDVPDEELPLALESLERWQVGDRMLDRLLRGHDLQQAQHAEWLRGTLPPGNLGRSCLDGITGDVVRIMDAAAPFVEGAADLHTIDLPLSGVRLTGRAATRGDVTLTVQFSKASPRHLVGPWLDALALTIALERPVDAVIFGARRRTRLTAPEPDQARVLLADLVALAVEGQQRVLPLPPWVSHLWAQCRARNTDPMSDRNLKARWKWDVDTVWEKILGPNVEPWDQPADGDPWAQRNERTLLGSLAAVVWTPIVGAER